MRQNSKVEVVAFALGSIAFAFSLAFAFAESTTRNKQCDACTKPMALWGKSQTPCSWWWCWGYFLLVSQTPRVTGSVGEGHSHCHSVKSLSHVVRWLEQRKYASQSVWYVVCVAHIAYQEGQLLCIYDVRWPPQWHSLSSFYTIQPLFLSSRQRKQFEVY